MKKKEIPQPTERELMILAILWKGGSGTVKSVNEEMNKAERVGYTTTLKLMQIMTEKGLLMRDDSQFKHIYKPAVTEESTQNQIVGNLLERAFGGSAEKLVMRALSAKKVSRKELIKIKKLLDEMEG